MHSHPCSANPARRGLQIACVAALAAVLTLQPGRSQAAAGATAQEAQQAAVTDIRNVGSAMYFWYEDQKASLPHAIEKDATSRHFPVVDLAQVPVISRDALEALLVPKYLKAVPKDDPWGHPYEFRLNTRDAAEHVMAVRSAGADGEFSGTVYEVGGFPPAEQNQDLVWADGYFLRWPLRAGN
jgi:hypothetical protein